jgi:hypothetical protein
MKPVIIKMDLKLFFAWLLAFSLISLKIYSSPFYRYTNTNFILSDTIIPFKIPDSVIYIKKLKQLANGDQTGRWPPATSYPLEGAILPLNRIVAYYGNFYCKQMGVLGEYPPDQMLEKLKAEMQLWEKADTLTPVIPALHYIAVTAQSNPCESGLYRLRMPDAEITKAIELAAKINGIVFLDVQVGLSNLEAELPRLEKFLKLPQVHLGIDPEYSMKSGKKPGSAIGTFDAADVNYAITFLAGIVQKNSIPPKILVVHRFTGNMLTNYKKIISLPQVQVIINMDGFGSIAKKKDTYQGFIYRQPVQFTGFKLFYKNDAKDGNRLMTPSEILKLIPIPVYIQYQ